MMEYRFRPQERRNQTEACNIMFFPGKNLWVEEAFGRRLGQVIGCGVSEGWLHTADGWCSHLRFSM